MNPDRREQVLDSARYLRSVRPLDPAEIAEYVEGQPHPAAVRQVIREAALDLEVVERADGSFVPVPDDPLSPVDLDDATVLDPASDAGGRGPAGARVRRVPGRHLAALDDALVGRFGPDWHRGESGHELRERVRSVKAAYLQGDPVEYDDVTALGYAVYHLPATYAAARYELRDLAVEKRVPRDLRVLDLGAGSGGQALALADLADGDALIDYHAVEPGAGADLLERFLADLGANWHASIHRTTAEAFLEDEHGPFDVILAANVLNELADPAGTLRTAVDALAPDGTLLALAPADRETAIGLRAAERAVADRGPATVYAPTVRLWPGESPESTSWSFDVKPDLDVPDVQRCLQTGAGGDPDGDGTDGEFVNRDVQYAYTVLRQDDRTRIETQGDRSAVAPMADADRSVTNRVDMLAVKLSHDLSESGNPLFLVGDGSQAVDHFAVLTDRTALNEDLAAADYGGLLAFENVLVLWNDDEAAYNVVVDEEVVVDVVER